MYGSGEELVHEKVVQGWILLEGRLDVPQESGPEIFLWSSKIFFILADG
jgi:hypothetical protein